MLDPNYNFVRDIVVLWGGDPDSIELVRDIINVVFRYEEPGQGGRYLRISKFWEPKKIIGATDYLRFLWAGGAPVCAPVAAKNGRFINYYTTSPGDGGSDDRYICRVYSEAVGETLTNRCTNPIIYEAWGKAIAQLHQVAIHYQPAPDLYFHTWEKEFQDTQAWLPPHDTIAWQEFERLRHWFDQMPPIDGGFGITHADCNAGNFVWNGRLITIIDFDEPMVNWFASDVARPFLEMQDFPLPLRRQLMAAFLHGYRQIRPLSEATAAALPYFMRFKTLAAYAWELGDCGTPFETDYLADLRRQFANPTEW